MQVGVECNLRWTANCVECKLLVVGCLHIRAIGTPAAKDAWACAHNRGRAMQIEMDGCLHVCDGRLHMVNERFAWASVVVVCYKS